MPSSPYLSHKDRLGDVLAAIQTLGTYRFYKLSPEGWSNRICGSGQQEQAWRTVFSEHPEFFRFSSDGTKVSLVLRRQKPKLFDVDALSLVSREERDARDASGQARISRAPLSDSELQFLVNMANDLHGKALEDRREGRWWVTMLVPVLVAAIGLVGVWLGASLKNEAPPVAQKIEKPESR